MRPSSSSYRAPELLFFPPSYLAEAVDRWSLGVILSEFFTPLTYSITDGGQPPTPSFSPSLDAPNLEFTTTDERKGWAEPFETGDHEQGAGGIRSGYFETKTWGRRKLFDAERGDIGLAGSIFLTRGSPGKASWPVSPLSRLLHLLLLQSSLY